MDIELLHVYRRSAKNDAVQGQGGQTRRQYQHGIIGLSRFDGGGYLAVSSRLRARGHRPETTPRIVERPCDKIQQSVFAHVHRARTVYRETGRENFLVERSEQKNE